MQHKFKSSLVGAVAVAAALAGAGLGFAHSGAGAATQITYTGAGANSTAGWSAFSPDLVRFSHIETYIGDAGDSSLENLPIASDIAFADPGDDITKLATEGAIQGGAGIQLCDRNTGHDGAAAQLGLVQVKPGWFDLVEGLGFLGNDNALNSSGNVCDNGLIGEAKGSTPEHVVVLLTNVHVNDTVKVGILYDPFHPFWFDTQEFPAGTITFYGTDLSNLNNTNVDSTEASDWFANNRFFTNEADAGVVSDTVQSPALTNLAVPAPNFGVLLHKGTSELVRFAHVKVNANNAVNGQGEVQGAFQSNKDWTTNPVAATTDGASTGLLYLDPSVFAADNFYVAGGLGLVLQGAR